MKALVIGMLLLLVATGVDHGPVPVAPKPKVKKKAPAAVVKHTDQQCLASAIYHEARGEPLEGQRAVYEVIHNRAKAKKKSLCAVVKAPKQFSWYGEKPILPMTKKLHELLQKVKNHPTVLDRSYKWFLGVDLDKKWSLKMDCRPIGGHKFCKEREQEYAYN